MKNTTATLRLQNAYDLVLEDLELRKEQIQAELVKCEQSLAMFDLSIEAIKEKIAREFPEAADSPTVESAPEPALVEATR